MANALAARSFLVATNGRSQKVAGSGVAPLDQSGKLELADLPLLGRLRAPCRNQAVHLLLHRLALLSPLLEHGIDHLTLRTQAAVRPCYPAMACEQLDPVLAMVEC